MTERRMWAYYYTFTPTGVDDIDAILEAVAIAGKAYHNTEYWADRDEDGNSLSGNIQNAANNAAEALKAPPQPMTEAAMENPAAFMAEVRELLQYVKSQWASEAELECSCCECEMNNRLDAMLARLEPFEIGAPDNKPQWSATPPKAQGYYWMKMCKIATAEIVYVTDKDTYYRGNSELPTVSDCECSMCVHMWHSVRIEEPR